MMRGLLIAEKPSLMRDIEKAYKTMNYPDELDFLSFVGHVVELKKPGDYKPEWETWKKENLPIIPSSFEYKPKQETKDVYDRIVKALKSGKYDYVINACDAGREGELIFHAFYSLVRCSLPVKRLWISDTTIETIQKGLMSLIDHNEPSLVRLRQCAEGRAIFDWLIGMNASQAFSLQTKKTVPLGRVMTPTLAIVVKREKEIQQFEPRPYWVIQATFDSPNGSYVGILKKDGEEKFEKKEAATSIYQKLKGAKTGEVVDIKSETKKQAAPSLHSLLELQKEANKEFGYSAQETLDIAQSLYEKHKLITYPRTESKCLSTALAKSIKKHIQALTVVDELETIALSILSSEQVESVMKNKRYVNDHQVTDHHAIIPTTIKPKLQNLSQKEKNIYLLVAKRFLAIFLPPFVYQKTTLTTKVQDECFLSEGKVVVDQGYMVLYPPKNKKDNEPSLPNISKGMRVGLKKLDMKEKQTTPPSRYDDSSLLQAMANAGRFVEEEEWKELLKEVAGLGTSATRAGIIEKLIQRGFIEKKGKVYYATPFGISVIDELKDIEIASPVLTAQWEKKLQEVEQGKKAFDSFYEEMISYTKAMTERLLAIGKPFGREVAEIGKCPKCNCSVIEGKNYFLCVEYKKTCDFIISKTILGANVTKQDVIQMLQGKTTREKTFTWKSGKQGKARLQLKNGEVTFVFDVEKTGTKKER